MTPKLLPLEKELSQRIKNRTGRPVYDLTIERRSDKVVLHGRAGSYYVKQVAQCCALEVLPSTRLENSIEVED